MQLDPLAKLAERAKTAGAVRPDATTADFGVVFMMVAKVMDAAQDVSPDLWRRYLRIALQGLCPQGSRLDALVVPAVEPRQLGQLFGDAWKR